MSEQTDTEDEYRIDKDYSENDPETGIETTRTVVMEVPALGMGTYGAKASFEWDDDSETYQLTAYRRQEEKRSGWSDRCTDFTRKDVGYLERIADHLRSASRGEVAVELFPSDE